jgi:hypothetical protein
MHSIDSYIADISDLKMKEGDDSIAMLDDSEDQYILAETHRASKPPPRSHSNEI